VIKIRLVFFSPFFHYKFSVSTSHVEANKEYVNILRKEIAEATSDQFIKLAE